MGNPTQGHGADRPGVWSVEQVESIAPSPSVLTSARPIATPGRWAHLGADDDAVWGSFRGSSAEPYDTVVDHRHVAVRCTCPSRKVPCKHALALLLLWIGGHVPEVVAPAHVTTWLERRRGANGDSAGGAPTKPDAVAGGSTSDGSTSGDSVSPVGIGTEGGDDIDVPPPPIDRTDARDDRVARMHEGLDELDRWLIDRMRTGLADPALAQFATWDSLAARLVDARAGSLANRVRRLAGLVGASADWHQHVLDEIGLLHLLSQAGRRLGTLPDDLADRVATTVGWQVRQADVLVGVPETDHWLVAGRSDTREDRIEVRRTWLRGQMSGRWALILSFAAYRQSLDTSLVVGTTVHADLHRYPGHALRALVGDVHSSHDQSPKSGADVALSATSAPDLRGGAAGEDEVGRRGGSIGEACGEVGRALATEPWLDRVPVLVRAAPTMSAGRWVLTDDTGSLPLDDASRSVRSGLPMLLAVSAAAPVDLAVEWTPTGLVPLTVFGERGAIDVGPRADPSFVGAA